MTDQPTESSKEPLSPSGTRRREAILSAALTEAAGRRRRRRVVRTSTAAAIAGMIAIAVIADRSRLRPEPVVVQKSDLIDVTPAPTPVPDPVPVQPTSRPSVATTAKSPGVVIEIIRTDPAIVERLSVPRSVGGWETIGTDELLRHLERIGLAGGVVVKDGKPRLWFAPSSGG